MPKLKKHKLLPEVHEFSENIKGTHVGPSGSGSSKEVQLDLFTNQIAINKLIFCAVCFDNFKPAEMGNDPRYCKRCEENLNIEWQVMVARGVKIKPGWVPRRNGETPHSTRRRKHENNGHVTPVGELPMKKIKTMATKGMKSNRIAADLLLNLGRWAKWRGVAGGIIKGNGGDEKGSLKPGNPSLLLALAVIGILVMAFIESASAEVVGGIIAGFFAIIIFSIRDKFRTFELRYINPRESIKPENMRRCTAIRMDVGVYITRIIVRPRQGMTLNAMGIAFFNPSWLPWKAGKRRSNQDIFASGFRYLDINGSWITPELEKTEHYSYVKLPELRLASHSQRVFELVINATDTVKPWQGILGFQMHFTRGGDPDRKNVNTKCIVCSPENRRPLRAIGKRILKCPLNSGE